MRAAFSDASNLASGKSFFRVASVSNASDTLPFEVAVRGGLSVRWFGVYISTQTGGKGGCTGRCTRISMEGRQPMSPRRWNGRCCDWPTWRGGVLPRHTAVNKSSTAIRPFNERTPFTPRKAARTKIYQTRRDLSPDQPARRTGSTTLRCARARAAPHLAPRPRPPAQQQYIGTNLCKGCQKRIRCLRRSPQKLSSKWDVEILLDSSFTAVGHRKHAHSRDENHRDEKKRPILTCVRVLRNIVERQTFAGPG